MDTNNGAPAMTPAATNLAIATHCPLCDGTGMETIDEKSGSGRSIRCRACNGKRLVTEIRAKAIKRTFSEWK